MFRVDLHTAFSLFNPNLFCYRFTPAHCSLELQVVPLLLRNILSFVLLYRMVFTWPVWSSVYNHSLTIYHSSLPVLFENWFLPLVARLHPPVISSSFFLHKKVILPPFESHFNPLLPSSRLIFSIFVSLL